MQRIPVPVQPIQRGLIRCRGLLNHGIGLPTRYPVNTPITHFNATLPSLLFSPPLSVSPFRIKPPTPPRELHKLVSEHHFPRPLIQSRINRRHQRPGALIHHIHELRVRDQRRGRGNRVLQDLKLVLPVHDPRGREVGEKIGDVVRESCVEEGDGAPGGKSLELRVLLVNQGQVGGCGGDVQAEGVEEEVFRGVGEMCALPRCELGFLDGGEVLSGGEWRVGSGLR